MRSLILSSVLLAATIALASYDAVPFPVGESIPFFDGAFRAVELQVRNASPANGTVNIGEIAARWETYNVVTNEGPEGFVYNLSPHEGVHIYVKPDNSAAFYYYETEEEKFQMNVGTGGDMKQYVSKGATDPSYTQIVTLTNKTDASDIVQNKWLNEVATNAVPHATTNAIWSVTATNGTGKAAFAPGTMEFFAPGTEFVRYGSATNGSCLLFLED